MQIVKKQHDCDTDLFLAPSTDDLIEVQVESGKGLNCMIIRVEDA